MNFLSITNLLYVFGIVLFIVLFVIVFTMLIKKEKVNGGEGIGPQGGFPKKNKKFSLAGLHDMRLWKGVHASTQYAMQYENLIIDQKASMVEYIDADDNEEMKLLNEITDSINHYQKLCESTAVAPPPKKPELFQTLREFAASDAKSESKPTLPVYECLLKLADSLSESNLMLMNSLLAKYKGSFPKGVIKNEQFSILVNSLSELTLSAQEAKTLFESNDQKNRQYAVTKIQGALRQIHEELTHARHEKGKSHNIPEISYLQGLSKRMLDLAKTAEISEAWKPIFEVKFMSEEDKLVVKERIIQLEFFIQNKNHRLSPVKEIQMQVMSMSNDLGAVDEHYSLNLSPAGSVSFNVVFRSYAFDTHECDPEPTIRFLITYFIKGKSLSQERLVTLPEIVVRKKTSNPFRDGIAGAALPGTSSLFSGRQEMLTEISRDMLNSETAPLFYLFHGHPRSGKTSIVKQLAENPKWLKEKYCDIWTNAESIQQVSNYYGLLYDRMEELLRNELGIHVKPPGKKPRYEDIPWWRIVDLLRKNADEILETKKRLLLVIDEYQKLSVWDEFADKDKDKIISSDVPYQFPEFIKVLRDESDGIITVILDGQLSLEEIASSGSHGKKWIQLLGGRLTQFPVTNFTPEEAGDLLKPHFRDNGIHLSQDILTRIQLYTAGHPWLHMLMGYHIFQQLIGSSGYELRQETTILREDVDNAARQIKGADMKFAWVEPWLIKDYNARVFLAALGEFSYTRAFTMGDLAVMPEVTLDDINDFLFYKLDIDPKLFAFYRVVPKLKKHNLLLGIENKKEFKLLYPLYAIFAHNEGEIHQLLNEELPK